MGTVRVVFVERDGKEVTVEHAPTGVSLMETAKANRVDGILGECGGGCACATCHVYVDAEWLTGDVTNVEGGLAAFLGGFFNHRR